MAKDHARVSQEQATQVGTEAYIYGYPLVTMEMTRRFMTNVSEPGGLRAPLGQFAHARAFPPATYRDIPGANADTLYSWAWLDLGAEPYIFSIPDSEGRYIIMTMVDGWTEVFQAPGTRTTGTKPQTIAITGPKWKGTLPEGVTEYRSSTDIVWIPGRTYTTGTPEDYAEAHALQDQLALVPLSVYGTEYTPPKGTVDPEIDMETPTKAQVMEMDAATYFKLLATLMKNNPPTAADTAIVAEMAKIGLIPGEDWDIAALEPAVAAGVAQAPKAALAKMAAHEPDIGTVVPGWLVTKPAGHYGINYLQRATLAWLGPGWSTLEDSVYPLTRADSDGKPLDGANRYVLHFPNGGLPPVKGFWSLTMYDSGGFLVSNPLGRVCLGSRDDFTYNDDGSLDIYVQKDSPGKDKEVNWLPCPEGAMGLFMRLYWPTETAPTILDGSWMPPRVRAVT